MATKFRISMLVLFLTLVTSTKTWGQDKYDYAIVSYVIPKTYIEVDINGVEYQKIEIDKSDRISKYLASPALKQVKLMNDNGWELFESLIRADRGTDQSHYTFLLRRKIE
jgi:hypothetical protein